MQCLKLALTFILCTVSIISCVCWVKSAVAEVLEKIGDPAKGVVGSHLVYGDESGKAIDLIETAKQQSKWNKLAAAFAAVASICQAALVVLPSAQ